MVDSRPSDAFDTFSVPDKGGAKPKPVVALLCGGNSSEREVSLASAANVEQVLGRAGYQVIKIDTATPRLFKQISHAHADVAFIALHGEGGEDGCIQGALELMGLPYTGSGVLASALAMDKYRAKIIYTSAGLNTPQSVYISAAGKDVPNRAGTDPEQIISKIGLPCVVKPTAAGSSVGITIVRDPERLPQALDDAFLQGSDVLIESYIAGTEITVPVLGGKNPKVLPTIEIIPKNEFYDYASKYDEGGSRHIVPARISRDAVAAASSAALLAHEALGCWGVSRTDMIVDADDCVWVIETNTIPGMTATSLLPDAAGFIGIDNQQLYELFIQWAFEAAEKRTATEGA
ncbi:MAG: D-alanine--D-alanine ligase [Coriobacteriales bacterium]|jgi:D-alanine-D-alanine ligase|nr:D-alanine--D-alanine ligase [Coriobacteriales bacterium]